MKVCSLCKEEKHLSNFRLRFRYGKHSPRSQCKPCESKQQVSRNRIRLNKNPDLKKKSLERVQSWSSDNKARRLKADNKNRKSRYHSDLDYRASRVSQSAKYRAQRLKATPPWLSPEQLLLTDRVYEVAVKISVTTGKPHDVDHIVPLQGENICGLHVPWNLAILPASMNRSKGNAYPSISNTA